MWAAWTSFTSESPSPSSSPSPPEPTPSVSAALGSVSQIPQWRLLSTVSQRVSAKWSRLSPLSTRLVVAAAAAVVAVAVGAAVLPRGGRRPRTPSSPGDNNASCGSVKGGEGSRQGAASSTAAAAAEDEAEEGEGDDIQFADPAESAFIAYVHRIKRQKESVLLSAIEQLESTAAELHAAQDVAAAGADASSSPADEGEKGVVALKAKVHRCAVVADELLTQWICSLDGVPVRQRENLKQRRKELVRGATLLSRRIAPYLHPTASSPAAEEAAPSAAAS